MLTDISLYWLTATAASSARLHHDVPRGMVPQPRPVPVGVAVFAHDITQSVRPLAERLYDIRHWSEFERGGHFAAMEVPELLAEDVRDFFLTDRAFFRLLTCVADRRDAPGQQVAKLVPLVGAQRVGDPPFDAHRLAVAPTQRGAALLGEAGLQDVVVPGVRRALHQPPVLRAFESAGHRLGRPPGRPAPARLPTCRGCRRG